MTAVNFLNQGDSYHNPCLRGHSRGSEKGRGKLSVGHSRSRRRQAIDSSALFERDSETRLVALGIDWSFLDVGRVRARIAAADAEAAGELAGFEQTVLLALEDTEDALVRYARTRFEAGAAGLFEVLDAERTQLRAQDALADARTRSVTGAVALYRALAGGWPQRLPSREQVAGGG